MMSPEELKGLVEFSFLLKSNEMFYRNVVFAALVWQLVPLLGADP